MQWTSTLNGFGEIWLARLTASSIELIALLMIGGCLWLLGRRHISPHAAYWLFMLVLVKAALPFHVAIPVERAWWPTFTIAQANGRVAGAATAKQELETAVQALQLPTEAIRSNLSPSAMSASATGATQPAVTPEENVTRPADALALPALASPSPAVALAWPAVFMLLWLAVVLLLAATTIWQQLLLVRSLRRCASVDFPNMNLAELAARLGLRQPVCTLACPGLAAPAVTGLLRPKLLMPEGLAEQLSRDQLEWVLLHELAHVRRGDLRASAMQRMLTIALFFHPAAWLTSWIIDQFRECACDDLALSATRSSRRACGEAFLAIVERSRQFAVQPMATLGMSRGVLLAKRRLLRLIDTKRAVSGGLSRRGVLGLGLLACLAASRLQASDETPEVTPHVTSSQESPTTSASKSASTAATTTDNNPTLNWVDRTVSEPKFSRVIVKNAGEVKGLHGLWLQERSKIRTARMRVRFMHLANGKEKDRLQQRHELLPKTRQEVTDALDSVDLAIQPHDLRVLRDQLLDGGLILDQPVWHVVDIIKDQNQVRVDWNHGETVLLRASHEMVADATNRQVTIYPGSHHHSFSSRCQELLVIPHFALLEARSEPASEYEPIWPGDLYGRIMFDQGGNLDRMYNENPGNHLRHDVFQYGYALFGKSRLLFPRVRAETKYSNGPAQAIDRVTISIIEDAEFNEPIPAEAFRVAVPANTAVWDRRKGLKLRAAEQPVEDVLTLFETSSE